jgi:hypothetical protein
MTWFFDEVTQCGPAQAHRCSTQITANAMPDAAHHHAHHCHADPCGEAQGVLREASRCMPPRKQSAGAQHVFVNAAYSPEPTMPTTAAPLRPGVPAIHRRCRLLQAPRMPAALHDDLRDLGCGEGDTTRLDVFVSKMSLVKLPQCR